MIRLSKRGNFFFFLRKDAANESYFEFDTFKASQSMIIYIVQELFKNGSSKSMECVS